MSVSDKKIDQELVEQFKMGDEMTFELIFHRTKGKLKGFLIKVLPLGADVESILQEIYLKIWSSRKSINAEKKFETYLYAIARNMVVDILRKRVHEQKYREELYRQLKEGKRNSLDTIATVEYSELEKIIFDLIEKLPEKRQVLFKLSRIDGLTYKEIALKLNISENTVDSQMRKALAFMRIEMKPFLSLILFIYFNQ